MQQVPPSCAGSRTDETGRKPFRFFIDVYAYTRDQLGIELRQQIALLWERYALADDEELTEAELLLNENLLTALFTTFG